MKLSIGLLLATILLLPQGGGQPVSSPVSHKAPPPTLEALVEAFQDVPQSEELNCLAALVYFESRSEPLEGQAAVAHVALNRVKARLWPNGLCAVAREPHQFADIDRTPHEIEAWKTARTIAWLALNGLPDPTNGATHFFAHEKVTPYWAEKIESTTTIQNHQFGREVR